MPPHEMSRNSFANNSDRHSGTSWVNYESTKKPPKSHYDAKRNQEKTEEFEVKPKKVKRKQIAKCSVQWTARTVSVGAASTITASTGGMNAGTFTLTAMAEMWAQADSRDDKKAMAQLKGEYNAPDEGLGMTIRENFLKI